MTIDDKIRDEKLPHSINREKAKRSALSSGKIDKYEFLTGEETLYLLYLQVLLQESLLKNKQKRLKIKAKSK